MSLIDRPMSPSVFYYRALNAKEKNLCDHILQRLFDELEAGKKIDLSSYYEMYDNDVVFVAVRKLQEEGWKTTNYTGRLRLEVDHFD